MNVTNTRRLQLKEWFSERPIPENEKSYISQLINGKASFGEKAARRLESTYGMPEKYLDAEPGTIGTAEKAAIYNASPVEIRGWIPLISYVDAGRWKEIIDLYEPGYAEQVLPTATKHSIHTFALRVDGDSMTLPDGVHGRSFPHGMIIYVDPMRACEIGDYVVARLSGSDSATFKKLTSEEGRPILSPLNPNRELYPIIRDEFEIIGRVIDASWGGI